MADQAPASAAAPIELINPIDAPVAATTRPAVPASPIAASTDVRTTASSLEDVIGAAVDAVASIESRAGRGTGFFVDRNTVLTNAHVVEGASSVSLYTANGTARARVASVADDYDLAVLKIDGATAPHAVLPLAATPAARVGQEVIAIGFAWDSWRTRSPGASSAASARSAGSRSCKPTRPSTPATAAGRCSTRPGGSSA